MKHLLILITILCFQSATAQQKILLHSGTVHTVYNVDAFTAEIIDGNDIFNGYYYRLLQFNDIPSEEQKLALAGAGLILMEYIPDNAFITAIPASFDKSAMKNFNVHSIYKMDAMQKLNTKLHGEAPDYSRKVQGYVDVTIQYYKNISKEDIPSLNEMHVLSSVDLNRTITVRVEEGKLATLASQAWVLYISPAGVPDIPDDTRGRSLHRSNVINSSYATGRHYDGAGIVIGLADDGVVGPHIDFTGRMTNHLTGAGGTHGDMTSGIAVGAANLDPTMKGMASGAYIHIYDISGYPHINGAVSNLNSLGTMITSTSYSQGCNEYTTDTQQGDQLIHENPSLEFVFSAGNNGTGNCQYGAGAGWGNITGGYKQGKNVIACGNLNPFDVLDGSSSKGPASDGRIKPDICANGLDQWSTDENNTYQEGGGTSAACPGIAGICAQMYQAYKSLNGETPESPLIKACLLNSAEDLGNAGPDFTYGWGRVNALRALTTLEDGRYIKDSISQGETNTHSITVPSNVSELRVMIYWLDPEGSPVASRSLVNNIDMHLTDPIALTWNPWVLDPTPLVSSITAPAVRGTDSLNNMEQVTVPAALPGTWTVTVEGTSIPSGPQTYYIVYEFRTEDITVTYPQGGEGFVPGELEVIRWDAIKGMGPFTVEYSTDNGSNWTMINSNVSQNTLYYGWVVPSVVNGSALVRVSRGGFSDVSDTAFAIINVPQNIQVDYTCVDSIRLTWNPVAGAVGYNIYVLDSMYMSVAGTSPVNSHTLTGTNPNQDYWFSVSAVTPEGTEGRRAYAVFKNAGIANCPLALDASLSSLLSPASGVMTDCQGNDSLSVTLLIENTGVNDIYNFDVSYSLNGGTAVTETVVDTIAPGTSLVYSFNGTVDLSTAGSYDIVSWLTFSGDLNIYNDSAFSSVNVISGTLAPVGTVENFESSLLCGTGSNCESTVCPLTGGWLNETNGAGDDIDFRVNSGATPSTGTGPAFDHTVGNASGRYIYLEASACFGKTAHLQSPCIDLTSSTGPELRFWYHMDGSDMGTLHVDVLSEGAWVEDIMTPLSGDHGNTWLQATADLSAFAGEVITIRFRAITGNDFESDLALDDISVVETNVAPSPSFAVNFSTSCIGNTIAFTDESPGNPTSWLWEITPSNVNFVNGTSAASQNPEVQFTATGAYTVKLVASNAFGTDSATVISFVNIVSASAIALTEDFQGAFWPPASWRVESAGNSHTWEPAFGITGSDGSSTNAARVNNFDYQPSGGQDGMTVVEVDLGSAANPILSFDVAYARANTFQNDGLRIDISTDCGNTFTPTGYLKQGIALATTLNTATPFVPTQAAQWRNDTLNLSSWASQHVTLRFMNISASGNNIYIDNINISDFNSVSENQHGAVQVYPNPSADGMYYIAIPGLKEDAVLVVLDAEGRQVINKNYVLNSDNTLDLSEMKSGVYLLEIRTPSSMKNVKLTKL